MSDAKVNLHNWRSHPHSQWAFVNVDKILPTAIIEKAEKPSNLPGSDVLDLSDLQFELAGSKLQWSSYLIQNHVDGIMILQHGKVLYEQYFNGNSRSSIHVIMSLTKSVTGLLVGILQAQGKLSASEFVSKYVPEISSSIWKDATIQTCLDMRVGAKYVDGQHPYQAAAGVAPRVGGEKFGNLREFLTDFVPDEIIDDRWQYLSGNIDLVGWVLERATGKTFADLVQELLWDPMGAESDALMCLDPEGRARASGGICATLPDIARLAQLILDDGRSACGEQLVPAEWLEDIVHGGSKDAWQRGVLAAKLNEYYGSVAYRSCFSADEDTETIMGFGAFGQHFSVDRKNKIVMVTTGSQPAAVMPNGTEVTLAAFKEVRRLLTRV